MAPLRVALINNSVTPYRLDLHRRLAREMPELQIWSLFTHELSNSPWQLHPPKDIRPVFFGAGDSSESDSIASQPDEWRKAGNIIKWLQLNQVRAVVLGGYNDIGRLRILWWCRHRKLPCFLFADSNIHCDNSAGWKRVLKRLLLPQILGLSSGVLCCGRLGEDYFQRYGVAQDRLFRFPYEPDYSELRSVGTEKVQAVRRTYGLREDRRYLIYSGRLIRHKRVDLLLAAFDRMSQLRPGWDLIIAGGGTERASLERLVTNRIAGRVVWTGFINDPDCMRALYAAANVLVLPSDYEPWGVVVTEAAVRMPVVASSVVGAAADIILDGANGRIFEAGNLDSLERCLLTVTDADTLSAMTMASPVRFAEWHGKSDPVKGLRSAFQTAALYS